MGILWFAGSGVGERVKGRLGFHPQTPARGMIPLDPRLSLWGDGRVGFHSDIQIFPQHVGVWESEAVFRQWRNQKRRRSVSIQSAPPCATIWEPVTPPSGGPRGPKPFSSSGGFKNGVGLIPYRARIARDNMETRGAPWRLSTRRPEAGAVAIPVFYCYTEPRQKECRATLTKGEG